MSQRLMTDVEGITHDIYAADGYQLPQAWCNKMFLPVKQAVTFVTCIWCIANKAGVPEAGSQGAAGMIVITEYE